MSTPTNERALYTSSDGQIVVSDKRLVLGGEQWSIGSIRAAKLISGKKILLGNWLKLNSRTIPNIAIAAICLFGGIGLTLLGTAIGLTGFLLTLLIAIAVILFLAGFFFIWRTYMLSLPDRYTLQLTLKDPTGATSIQTARYQWNNQLQALEVEQAIAQAVASR